MTANTPAIKRPGGVTFLVVIAYINGIFSIITGVLALISVASPEAVSSTGMGSAGLVVFGIVQLLLGLLYIYLARGLSRGDARARLITIVINILVIVSGVFGFILPGNQRGTSLVQVVLAIISLVILFTPRAKEFFRVR